MPGRHPGLLAAVDLRVAPERDGYGIPPVRCEAALGTALGKLRTNNGGTPPAERPAVAGQRSMWTVDDALSAMLHKLCLAILCRPGPPPGENE